MPQRPTAGDPRDQTNGFWTIQFLSVLVSSKMDKSMRHSCIMFTYVYWYCMCLKPFIDAQIILGVLNFLGMTWKRANAVSRVEWFWTAPIQLAATLPFCGNTSGGLLECSVPLFKTGSWQELIFKTSTDLNLTRDHRDLWIRSCFFLCVCVWTLGRSWWKAASVYSIQSCFKNMVSHTASSGSEDGNQGMGKASTTQA